MLGRAWTKLEHFWFSGQSSQTLRVLLSLWAALNVIDIVLTWLPFFDFGSSQPWGIFRLWNGLRAPRWWNIFTYFDSPIALYGSLLILIVALIWLIVGRHYLRPVLAVALYFVCCFHHSGGQSVVNPYALVRFSGFCLLFAPATWALRLIQLRFSLVYLGAAGFKFFGPAWISGEASLFSMQIPTAASLFILNHLDAMNFPLWSFKISSWAVIAAECFIGLALWSPRLRRGALALAAVFHLGLACVLSAVQFFQLIMLFGLAAFMDWDSVRKPRVGSTSFTTRSNRFCL